jgi:tRNA(Ile)-lysidine synthase
LPELRKYNPQIAQALLRLARTAADDLDYIENEARRLMDGIVKAAKGSVAIDKKAFLATHPALQRQILRLAIERLLGSLNDIESGHIEDIMAALKKPAGRVIGLPFGINFNIEYDRYVLASAASPPCPFPGLKGETVLEIPGRTLFCGWEIDAKIIKQSEIKGIRGKANDFTAHLGSEMTGKNLIVRARLPGDRFQPLGMAQPKRLNIFMMDARIPRAWRNRIPIVCSGVDILWVVGYRIDERYKVQPDTENVLRLEFRRV